MYFDIRFLTYVDVLHVKNNNKRYKRIYY